MSNHDGRPTDWRKLLRSDYTYDGKTDRVTVTPDAIEAMRDRIAHLEFLLPQAFDAGVAYGIASHRDFQQINPDRDAWVRGALVKDEEDQ